MPHLSSRRTFTRSATERTWFRPGHRPSRGRSPSACVGCSTRWECVVTGGQSRLCGHCRRSVRRRAQAPRKGRIHARDLAGESPGQVWAGENPHDVAARRAGGIGPSRLLHPALLRQPARRALVKSSRKPVASSDMRPEVGGCRAPRVRRWAGPPPPAPRRTSTACPIRRCRDGHRWRRPRVVVVDSSGKCPRRTAGRRAPTANPRGRCRPTARFSAPTPKLLVRAGHEPGPHRSPTTGRAQRGRIRRCRPRR